MKQSKISFDCKINMIFDFFRTKFTVAFIFQISNLLTSLRSIKCITLSLIVL